MEGGEWFGKRKRKRDTGNRKQDEKVYIRFCPLKEGRKNFLGDGVASPPKNKRTNSRDGVQIPTGKNKDQGGQYLKNDPKKC